MVKALWLVTGLSCALGIASCGSEDDAKKVRDGTAGESSGGGEPMAAAGMGGSAAGTDGALGDAGMGGSIVSENGGAAGAGPTACVLARDWQVVDDFARMDGVATNAANIAADLEGNVYAVGLGRADIGDLAGLVRRSLDAGATWEDAPGWATPTELPNDVAVGDGGDVFVTAGTTVGHVYRSTNQGATFESVLDIPTTPGPTGPAAVCNTGFVATGANGVVVAGGSCDDDGFTIHKSTNGGDTWEPAFTFRLAAGKTARLHDVAVGPDGTAYASGEAVDENDEVHWVVVREGAATGVVSDDFQLADGLPARAFGFASRGALWVTGSASDAQGTHGVVRRMTAPDTWQTLDTFDTRGADIEASDKHVIVTGQLESPAVHAITRQSDDDGATWADSVEYEYAADQPAFVSALTADGLGSFYGIVSARDENAVPRWIVRKLACE